MRSESAARVRRRHCGRCGVLPTAATIRKIAVRWGLSSTCASDRKCPSDYREIVTMPDLSGPAPTSHYHFDTLFDSFVINLKRQPEKLQTFIERNRSAGIDFQHFEAVDGAQCNIFDMIGGQVVARGAVNYTPGAIGNALSHLALWRRCVEQNKHFIIFEDDAVVRNDFKVRLSPPGRAMAGTSSCWVTIRTRCLN